MGVFEIWVPAKDQKRNMNVPTNSPITATRLLRALSAIFSIGNCAGGGFSDTRERSPFVFLERR